MAEFHISISHSTQKMPGVVKVITAKDIPGVNNFSMLPIAPEEVRVIRAASSVGKPDFGQVGSAPLVSLHVQFFFFVNPKFQASVLLLWLYKAG